jgi:hypothetical protein
MSQSTKTVREVRRICREEAATLRASLKAERTRALAELQAQRARVLAELKASAARMRAESKERCRARVAEAKGLKERARESRYDERKNAAYLRGLERKRAREARADDAAATRYLRAQGRAAIPVKFLSTQWYPDVVDRLRAKGVVEDVPLEGTYGELPAVRLKRGRRGGGGGRRTKRARASSAPAGDYERAPEQRARDAEHERVQQIAREGREARDRRDAARKAFWQNMAAMPVDARRAIDVDAELARIDAAHGVSPYRGRS